MSVQKEHVIITASDAKYGDFLIDNWLKSLVANVDLGNIDVFVLDYGLRGDQREELEKSGVVKVFPCIRDGHIVIIRFRDISNLLKNSSYKQVLTCDGGDIIFQKDIRPLFEKDTHTFRAACEDYALPLDTLVGFQKSIDPKIMPEIRRHTHNKRPVNAGVLVGPREKFIELCDFCYTYTINKEKFGSDQILINCFLYKNGFVELDRVYNFIVYSSESSFRIRDGVFLDDVGGVIPIVHNAGRFSFFRTIGNFGYGRGHNKIRFVRFYVLRMVGKLSAYRIFGQAT